MPRYKLTIEYDGTDYAGWQRQPNRRSVQEALEEAAQKLCGAETAMRGAGRTDAGVHAFGQVAHCDFARDWRPDVVRDGLNAHLRARNDAAAVLSAERAADDFDARLSAVKRHYLYRILDRRPPPALEKLRAWHVPKRLDEAAMAREAKSLLGHHDFTTFRSTECQAKSPMRTLDACDVARSGEMLEVRVSARSFLHHQVRSMVGSLVEIGRGNWVEGELAERLAAKDRAMCGPQAPSMGLYFVAVEYGCGRVAG
jgi:tRNA pseudouridine38-40 synthase